MPKRGFPLITDKLTHAAWQLAPQMSALVNSKAKRTA